MPESHCAGGARAKPLSLMWKAPKRHSVTRGRPRPSKLTLRLLPASLLNRKAIVKFNRGGMHGVVAKEYYDIIGEDGSTMAWRKVFELRPEYASAEVEKRKRKDIKVGMKVRARPYRLHRRKIKQIKP